MSAPPVTSPGLCSTICRDLDEPMPGTAVVATGWVVVEQPGPWGAKAPTQSHLDPDLGRRVDAACKKADLRFGLIRSPGRHADAVSAAHQVYVASSVPGRTWLLGGLVDDPLKLDELDLEAVRRGDLVAVRASLPELSPVTRPVLLICTNGKRDECCALFGRPVVAGLAAVAPGRVWESNHLSGHRFSPTGTLLPAGTMHGRLTVESAAAVLAAADRGETVLATLRGRSAWTKRGQVAEIAVRDLIGEVALDALGVVAEEVETVTVQHTDGRTWQVEVTTELADPPRPESCGKEPYDMSILRAGTVQAGDRR
ncbi:Sucraseferredoxin family protein [Kribbella flavida DSM 17836]|uniref:Sucraseferredoxin family protein n=1 Tax=Kribbella flavida (strain DSM 17836 / JCM 10339 / NBRC 14399) TaxID=479435 RepID=D2PLS8_KRIFD|nr:sucrase ferredoxin [Kribbella flavida]ADB32508.1 Sucraseferredoxin family protein [Kribbella flavida DSM 17836]